jgi:hypothetical protein
MRLIQIFALTVLAAANLQSSAQTGWFARYEARTAATQLNQPHWATPLVTSSPRIEQGLRADFVGQMASNSQTTWNDGNSKGLQFIPFPRTELRTSPPPFITHSNPAVSDGFGDIAFRLKYRLYGSNEDHHNAILTTSLSASLPTGKNTNGSCCAILTPSLEIGKGFGNLALTTAAVANLPASNTLQLGRSVSWNNAIQYKLSRLIWIQTEFNTTFYTGGSKDGKQQTFATPGILISRIPLHHQTPTHPVPLLLSLGAGEQIALTHFNTYEHSPIFTTRLRF